jgi:hypothetical protein
MVTSRDAFGRWLQPIQLAASSPEAGAQFGSSVAVSGDFVAVGAPFDDLGPSQDVGVVHVFRRTSGAWALDAVIAASDAQAGDQFGAGVAMAEGRLFVGVPGDDVSGTVNCGSVRVYEKSGFTWTQVALLRPSDSAAGDAFGCSVSASGAVRSDVRPAARGRRTRSSSPRVRVPGTRSSEARCTSATDGPSCRRARSTSEAKPIPVRRSCIRRMELHGPRRAR